MVLTPVEPRNPAEDVVEIVDVFSERKLQPPERSVSVGLVIKSDKRQWLSGMKLYQLGRPVFATAVRVADPRALCVLHPTISSSACVPNSRRKDD